MDVGGRWRLAVGAPCVVEYLLSPPTHLLPRMPAHCLGVLVWQERLIPILDLAPVFSERPIPRERSAARAVVLAYQESPGKPLSYGAVVVRSAPVEVWASDHMARSLPEHSALRKLSRSCFAHGEELIPVLDTKRLFATSLADPVEPVETKEDEAMVEATAMPVQESLLDLKELEPEIMALEAPAPANFAEPESRPEAPSEVPAVPVLDAPAAPPAAPEDTAFPPETQPADDHRSFSRAPFWIAAALTLVALAALAAVLLAH